MLLAPLLFFLFYASIFFSLAHSSGTIMSKKLFSVHYTFLRQFFYEPTTKLIFINVERNLLREASSDGIDVYYNQRKEARASILSTRGAL